MPASWEDRRHRPADVSPVVLAGEVWQAWSTGLGYESWRNLINRVGWFGNSPEIRESVRRIIPHLVPVSLFETSDRLRIDNGWAFALAAVSGEITTQEFDLLHTRACPLPSCPLPLEFTCAMHDKVLSPDDRPGRLRMVANFADLPVDSEFHLGVLDAALPREFTINEAVVMAQDVAAALEP